MRVNKWILALITAIVAVAPALAAPPAGEFSAKTSDTGVKYITGGVGESNAAQMESRFADYSFKLVSVRADGGAYLADVKTVITDAQGKKVLQATTEGPWLIADLKPGTYKLQATHDGHTRNQSFKVNANSRERLVLRWDAPGEAAASAATGQSAAQSRQVVAGPAPERTAGEVEAPDKVISTPAADDAAPASQAPKTVVPGAKTKTIHVSPEKARELEASGKAQPKSEHPGEAAGAEHPGSAVGQ